MHPDAPDLRFTPQRRAVLDVLRASYDHPNAGEVLDRVRELVPGIGAATVYRSLAHLVESGHALEISFGNGPARYDANVVHHDHLICDTCGRAVDVPLDTAEPVAARFAERLSELAAATGFDITAYDLRFHGRCGDCRAAHTPKTPASNN